MKIQSLKSKDYSRNNFGHLFIVNNSYNFNVVVMIAICVRDMLALSGSFTTDGVIYVISISY